MRAVRMGDRASRRFAAGMAGVLATALAVSGCASTTITPLATASPAQPSSSLQSSTPASSPALSGLYPLWTPTPQPTEAEPVDPDATPTPPLPKGPLPSVAPAPAGIWTSIKWLAVPGGHSPAVKLPPQGFGAVNAYIGGWSKGFVEFVWDNNLRTLTPWVSADGLRWSAGRKMDTSVWNADFKEFDADSEPAERGQCFVRVGTFQEGPANLLVSAAVDCFSGDRCAGPDSPITTSVAWWTSPDGITWGPVPSVSDIRDGVVVSGGSSGYIRYDYGKLSTSADGKSWQAGVLPSMPAGSTVEMPIAMNGGYVLPAVMRVKAGHKTPQEGCLGYVDLSQYEGALWWSPDGTNWTRDTINSFARYSPGVRMEVFRLNDHSAIAVESEGDSLREWVSSDGRNWTQMRTVLIEPGSDHIICGYDHGLVATQDYKQFFGFDATHTLRALKQTGSIPWIDDWQIVIGPTGLLVTQNGTRFWLGVPGA